MISATINGQEREFADGLNILQALASVGVELPSLCHDDRLEPCGSCRLCLVTVSGRRGAVAACTTPLADRMVIETHTPALESGRRAELRMLARRYPSVATDQAPEMPFHRWLRHYGIQAAGVDEPHDCSTDDSHPYLLVDMSRCIHCYRCVRICDELQGQFVWNIFGRGDDSEIVAGLHQPLAASGCVSCGACADTCPTGAIADKPLPGAMPAATWTRTTCPYCGTGCEMNVGVERNKIVSVKPVMDAPVNKGHLCVKGNYAFQFNSAPDRIQQPMVRLSGTWVPVSWEEAIAFTGSELRRIRESRGPDSIGILGSARATNEENYVAQKFARTVIGTNNIDCCARVCHAPTAVAMGAMLGTGAATNSYDDIEKARTIMVCGANATENHPIVGARIKKAALHGTTLIVVDPRHTELSKFAKLHLQIRPGTDIALFNGMANIMIAERLVDQTYVENRVNGLAEFSAAVREWTPDRAAAVCNVEVQRIVLAAHLYATAHPAMIIHGLGITEQSQGTEGVMCLVNLALLTGNLGQDGGGINPLRGQNNVQGSAHMGCEPEHLTGFASLPAARAKFESAWGFPVPERPGKHLMSMMDAAAIGEFAALWAIGYDVFFTNADASATRKSLSKLELVIVQDMFLNETAREFGTVFFPCASSFEKEGTFMNAERRVQRVRKALEPPGQARTDWEIVCAVAAAMGHPEGFRFNNARQIWDEVRTVWPGGAGMSYARLDLGGLQWPCPNENHPGTAVLHKESFASGPKATLRAIPWHPPPEQASTEFPLLLITGRSLYHFNAGTMTSRTPNLAIRPSDTLDLAPSDAIRLGIENGCPVCVSSRYGSAELPARVSEDVPDGHVFSTFHSSQVFLNRVTSPHRDRITGTPVYKVTAVRVERLES